MKFKEIFILRTLFGTQIPPDILRKIDEQFQDEIDRQEVKKEIGNLWTIKLNVGAPQLARSILIIADGKIEELRNILKDFFGDPRDVIGMAERKVGNPGHYFIPTFEEIEK